jgi:hypothetical protein
MSLAFDEYGRPFLIIRVRNRFIAVTVLAALVPSAADSDHFSFFFYLLQEQEKKSRVKGIDAVKSNIQAAKAVSRVLRTSLGPKGMDKLLQSPDGDIVISKFCLYTI